MRHWSNPIAIAKIAISFDLPKAFGRFSEKGGNKWTQQN